MNQCQFSSVQNSKMLKRVETKKTEKETNYCCIQLYNVLVPTYAYY